MGLLFQPEFLNKEENLPKLDWSRDVTKSANIIQSEKLIAGTEFENC